MQIAAASREEYIRSLCLQLEHKTSALTATSHTKNILEERVDELQTEIAQLRLELAQTADDSASTEDIIIALEARVKASQEDLVIVSGRASTAEALLRKQQVFSF